MLLLVVAIINHKEILTAEEKISLEQCLKKLGKYPLWMIVPQKLNTNKIEIDFPTLKILRVADKYLKDYRAFNRFKINPFLYKFFRDYKYLLYYELDAFIFNDSVVDWCSLDLDYIGAPWLKVNEVGKIEFTGVGNGGFSLRKISSHLKVLNQFTRINSVDSILSSWKRFNLKGKLIYAPRTFLRLLGIKGNTCWYFNDWDDNEDIFWSMKVPAVVKWFKVAEPSLAMKFSFELNPELLYHFNNNKLPLGCHAWYKTGQIEFWRPFIQKEGYSLDR